MWDIHEIVPDVDLIETSERLRLEKHVANWTYLSSYLSRGVTREEVGIMIAIELGYKNRDHIVQRLVGKLSSMYKDYLQEELRQ